MFNISTKTTKAIILVMMLCTFFVAFISCQNISHNENEPPLTIIEDETRNNSDDLLTETMEQPKQTETFLSETLEQIELYTHPNTHISITDASKISQIKRLISDILDEDNKVFEQENVEGQTIHIKMVYESDLVIEYNIIANTYLEYSGHSYYISDEDSERIDQLIGSLIH